MQALRGGDDQVALAGERGEIGFQKGLGQGIGQQRKVVLRIEVIAGVVGVDDRDTVSLAVSDGDAASDKGVVYV